MSSVDARSHVNKQLLDINTFRSYTNNIQAMQKTPWGKDIGKHYINIPAGFIKLKELYTLQKGSGMSLIFSGLQPFFQKF